MQILPGRLFGQICALIIVSLYKRKTWQDNLEDNLQGKCSLSLTDLMWRQQ